MSHPALLFLIVSGFAIALTNSWGLLYKANLLLHPLLGAGFTALMFWFAWRRFSRLGERFSARLWVAAPMLLSVVLAIPGISAATRLRFDLLFGLLAAWLLVGMTRLGRAVALRELFVAQFNYVAFGVWCLSLFTGLSTLFLSQRGGIPYIVETHHTVNLVFCGLFVAHIVLTLAGVFARSTEFAEEQPRIFASVVGMFSRIEAVSTEQPRAWRGLLYAGAAAGVLAGFFLLDRARPDPSFTVPLSTIPLEDRIESERVVHFDNARVSPAALDLVDACGGAGACHQEIIDGYRDSNHNISMTTPHMAKVLSLLDEEVGAHNRKICAGCHTPYALFEASADDAFFAAHDNISCSFCHMVRDVWIGPKESLRSSYTLRPPVRHLELFLEDGAESRPAGLDAFLINLNPLGHGRAFSDPLLADDTFCASCHHHQITGKHQQGLIRPRCVDCHMRPGVELAQEGQARSHSMPGANVAVPELAGRPAAAYLVKSWIDGRYPFSFPGWENRGWERLGGRKQATSLWMVFASRTPPIPGRDYTVEILTSNVGMEHRFPAAPYDLLEAWLEVRVQDAAGRSVFENGFPNERGVVPPDARRLGGYVVGEDGKKLEHYRVWRPQKNVVEREIGPGITLYDPFTFPIPANAQGPLRIEAAWRYRKLSRDFLDWAYGPEFGITTLAVVELRGEIPLEPRPDTAAVPEASSAGSG